jgi:hypothetical protein
MERVKGNRTLVSIVVQSGVKFAGELHTGLEATV